MYQIFPPRYFTYLITCKTNILRWLEFFVSLMCLGVALYLCRTNIYPLIKLIIVIVSAMVALACFFDCICNLLRIPLSFTTWIMLSLGAFFGFCLCAGLLMFLKRETMGKLIAMAGLINLATALLFFFDYLWSSLEYCRMKRCCQMELEMQERCGISPLPGCVCSPLGQDPTSDNPMGGPTVMGPVINVGGGGVGGGGVVYGGGGGRGGVTTTTYMSRQRCPCTCKNRECHPLCPGPCEPKRRAGSCPPPEPCYYPPCAPTCPVPCMPRRYPRCIPTQLCVDPNVPPVNNLAGPVINPQPVYIPPAPPPPPNPINNPVTWPNPYPAYASPNPVVGPNRPCTCSPNCKSQNCNCTPNQTNQKKPSAIILTAGTNAPLPETVFESRQRCPCKCTTGSCHPLCPGPCTAKKKPEDCPPPEPCFVPPCAPTCPTPCAPRPYPRCIPTQLCDPKHIQVNVNDETNVLVVPVPPPDPVVPVPPAPPDVTVVPDHPPDPDCPDVPVPCPKPTFNVVPALPSDTAVTAPAPPPPDSDPTFTVDPRLSSEPVVSTAPSPPPPPQYDPTHTFVSRLPRDSAFAVVPRRSPDPIVTTAPSPPPPPQYDPIFTVVPRLPRDSAFAVTPRLRSDPVVTVPPPHSDPVFTVVPRLPADLEIRSFSPPPYSEPAYSFAPLARDPVFTVVPPLPPDPAAPVAPVPYPRSREITSTDDVQYKAYYAKVDYNLSKSEIKRLTRQLRRQQRSAPASYNLESNLKEEHKGIEQQETTEYKLPHFKKKLLDNTHSYRTALPTIVEKDSRDLSVVENKVESKQSQELVNKKSVKDIVLPDDSKLSSFLDIVSRKDFLEKTKKIPGFQKIMNRIYTLASSKSNDSLKSNLKESKDSNTTVSEDKVWECAYCDVKSTSQPVDISKQPTTIKGKSSNFGFKKDIRKNKVHPQKNPASTTSKIPRPSRMKSCPQKPTSEKDERCPSGGVTYRLENRPSIYVHDETSRHKSSSSIKRKRKKLKDDSKGNLELRKDENSSRVSTAETYTASRPSTILLYNNEQTSKENLTEGPCLCCHCARKLQIEGSCDNRDEPIVVRCICKKS